MFALQFSILSTFVAATSAQSGWWTNPKAVVEAANAEFAAFFEAGNFTGCASTYVDAA